MRKHLGRSASGGVERSGFQGASVINFSRFSRLAVSFRAAKDRGRQTCDGAAIGGLP